MTRRQCVRSKTEHVIRWSPPPRRPLPFCLSAITLAKADRAGMSAAVGGRMPAELTHRV